MKMQYDFKQILASFNLNFNECKIISFGTGLINNTWKIENKKDGAQYILQRINDTVFKNPNLIAKNIDMVSDYLFNHYPNYLFVTPIKTIFNKSMLRTTQGYFRIFPFVHKSKSIIVINTPKQAYQAAAQFAKFTKLLSRFNVKKLNITLPNFHNISLRFQQFEKALIDGNKIRINEITKEIKEIKKYKYIVEYFETIKQHIDFKIRVTHHDTKISNVLFNNKNDALCIIDLDTIMPGYFISDVGDMMRTYLSPANEEESNLEKVYIRKNILNAIIKGYKSEMGNELTDIENTHFVYAGKFMIYMQALRFITDYLNNDIYYTIQYPNQNLIRAKNQIHLLNQLTNFE